METDTHRLTFCRHDHMHCSLPGLFQSKRRGDRGHLDIRHQINTTTIRVVCFQQLGADDLRYLQGLVALAGLDGQLLSATPTLEVPRQLRESLQSTSLSNAIFVTGHTCSLLREVGLTDGGANIEGFRSSLTRLANVTIYVSKREIEESFHLLSYRFDTDSGSFTVALNPAIAEAISGDRHTRIDLAEVRQLSGDAALILHQRLCANIGQGRSRDFKLATLLSYVWPEAPKASAQSKQKQRLRSALEEIARVGWKVTLSTSDKVRIYRPADRSNGQHLRSNGQKNRSNSQRSFPLEHHK
jgi:hypothetical protein